MIAKCKAIAHGSNALEYIFRERKLGRILVLHNLCRETPKEIHEEMKLTGDYNSRCKNKFLRVEIGIAPQDEPRMTFKTLNRLALLFAKQMGLDDHQWVAVTHKDTDNLHSHIMARKSIVKIANRFFSESELNQLSVVAPNVTWSIIRDYEVVEKRRVAMPDELTDIVRCNNPKCICNNEPMPTRFTVSGNVLRCHYCEMEQPIGTVKLV